MQQLAKFGANPIARRPLCCDVLQGAVQMVPPERLDSLKQREGVTRLKRLRDDRYLLGIGPAPAPFRPIENLDPARPTHSSVIAMFKHMVKSIA